MSSLLTEKIHLKTELVQLEEEKSILENDLQARQMKLIVKEEEWDQSKKEAEMLKKSTIQLAKEKFKLEDELRRKSELGVEMGKEIDELRAELKKMRREKAKAEKTSLLLKVCSIYIRTVAPTLETSSTYWPCTCLQMQPSVGLRIQVSLLQFVCWIFPWI